MLDRPQRARHNRLHPMFVRSSALMLVTQTSSISVVLTVVVLLVTCALG
jgi:hypothetical protein